MLKKSLQNFSKLAEKFTVDKKKVTWKDEKVTRK